MQHRSLTECLASKEATSLDAYVLLDAQDWMTEEVLNDLWGEIERTARPGARVIFRTAGEESILPGRVPDLILSKFTYDPEKCRALTAKDRSSIYGGFHLYVLTSRRRRQREQRDAGRRPPHGWHLQVSALHLQRDT